MNNFWQRAITGTIFVIVLVGTIILGGWYMHSLFGLIAILGLNEFYNLFQKTEVKPNKFIGLILATSIYALIISANYVASDNFRFLSGVIIALVFSSLILAGILELFRNNSSPFQNISVTLVGIFYVVFPFTLINFLPEFAQIKTIDDKYWSILSIFILIWSNDTFAYLTGRLIGKHKLFERISPKKTWEGFTGGILFSVIAGLVLAYFLDWSYPKMIAYGLIVGIFGTAGDLVESMLKRSVDIKDSGNILPGHGGILDRFDAVLFVVPIIFVLELFIF